MNKSEFILSRVYHAIKDTVPGAELPDFDTLPEESKGFLSNVITEGEEHFEIREEELKTASTDGDAGGDGPGGTNPPKPPKP